MNWLFSKWIARNYVFPTLDIKQKNCKKKKDESILFQIINRSADKIVSLKENCVSAKEIDLTVFTGGF